MSCGEKWEAMMGSVDMHDMSDEHLESAQREAKRRLNLASSSLSSAGSDAEESMRRLVQLDREMTRRQLAVEQKRRRLAAKTVSFKIPPSYRLGIGAYGSEKTFRPGQYAVFLAYSAEEKTPDPPTFTRGDLLVVDAVGNGVSEEMLDVHRIMDSKSDSVWPEEICHYDRAISIEGQMSDSFDAYLRAVTDAHSKKVELLAAQTRERQARVREEKANKAHSALRNEIYRLDSEARSRGYNVISLRRLIRFMEDA